MTAPDTGPAMAWAETPASRPAVARERMILFMNNLPLFGANRAEGLRLEAACIGNAQGADRFPAPAPAPAGSAEFDPQPVNLAVVHERDHQRPVRNLRPVQLGADDAALNAAGILDGDFVA